MSAPEPNIGLNDVLFGNHQINEFMNQIQFKSKSFPEVFQCLFGVTGEVSKANGLAEKWAKYESTLQTLIDNWMNCDGAGKTIDIFLYVSIETFYIDLCFIPVELTITIDFYSTRVNFQMQRRLFYFNH